jgi:hypothetical protein
VGWWDGGGSGRLLEGWWNDFGRFDACMEAAHRAADRGGFSQVSGTVSKLAYSCLGRVRRSMGLFCNRSVV